MHVPGPGARGAAECSAAPRHVKLRAGDSIVLEADPSALDEFRASLDLEFADDRRMTVLEEAEHGLSLVEVVVTEGSRINGKSAQAIGLALAAAHDPHGHLAAWPADRGPACGVPKVRTGDILLLLAPAEKRARRDRLAGIACRWADRGLAVTENRKDPPRRGAVSSRAVASASFGLVRPHGCAGRRRHPLRARPDRAAERDLHPCGMARGRAPGLDDPAGRRAGGVGGATGLIAGWLTALTDGRPAWLALTVLSAW